MQIQPFEPGNFGVTITDFDCAGARFEDGVAILDLLFIYKVLVIKEQHLTPTQYEKFMSLLGAPVPHVLYQYCLPGHRNILRISNYVLADGTPTGVREGGAYWHTDMSYLASNTVATSLYSQQIPQSGTSETHFIDCAAAYLHLRENGSHAGLSHYGAMPDIDLAQVVHRFGNRKALTRNDANSQKLSDEQQAVFSDVTHPLVLVHPKTRVAALYALSGTSVGIEGWDEAVSRCLLDDLETFVLSHAPKYRHVYGVGDLVIWDNLSTLHRGIDMDVSYSLNDCRTLYRMNVNYLGRY